jgi:hypothetical protein
MNRTFQREVRPLPALAGLLTLALLSALPAAAQQPRSVPLDKPITIKQSKPKSQYEKFQGTVMHANNVQITVRGIENELAIRTFPLSREAADKMEQIINRGGYQYGDKVTITYDPVTQQAVKIKGKPSRPL